MYCNSVCEWRKVLTENIYIFYLYWMLLQILKRKIMTSWLTSALQTAREKSLDALDFVRKDLSEFTTTVKTDTESYLNKVKTEQVGDLGLNRLVSRLSEAVASNTTDGKGPMPPITASFERIQSELSRVQKDESTYLIDPVPTESYEHWRQSSGFNVDMRKGDIAQLLIDAPHVRLFYARLVPAQTTHSDFWSRYYFRLWQLDEEEARRTQLLKRAHEICNEDSEQQAKNNENDWDEPDEEWPQGSSTTVEEIKPTSVVVEHHEEPVVAVPESEPEKTNSERKESDTVSGDSWEREFDEADLLAPAVPSKTDDLPPPVEPPRTVESGTSSMMTTTTAPPPSSSSSSMKKTENEFDDEWEAWS